MMVYEMNEELVYQICRLCGYIRKTNEDGKVCPACGAPPTSFAPYLQKVSDSRLKLLSLDIHPVVVHFTVSYTVTTTILYVLSFLSPVKFGIDFQNPAILDFFLFFFPVFVLAGGLTGIMDGKVRFRKLKTPFLKRKMILATSLLIVSIMVFILHFAFEGGTKTDYSMLELLFLVLGVILASLLGWFGSKLVCPIVPKGMEKR